MFLIKLRCFNIFANNNISHNIKRAQHFVKFYLRFQFRQDSTNMNDCFANFDIYLLQIIMNKKNSLSQEYFLSQSENNLPPEMVLSLQRKVERYTNFNPIKCLQKHKSLHSELSSHFSVSREQPNYKQKLQNLQKQFIAYTTKKNSINKEAVYKKRIVKKYTFKKGYQPQTVVYISAHPTSTDRCHLIFRNSLGCIISVYENLRRIKRFKKCLLFLLNKPQLFCFFIDYCPLSQISLSIFENLTTKSDFFIMACLKQEHFILNREKYLVLQQAYFQKNGLNQLELPTTINFPTKAERIRLKNSTVWLAQAQKVIWTFSKSISQLPVKYWELPMTRLINFQAQEHKILLQFRQIQLGWSQNLQFDSMIINLIRKNKCKLCEIINKFNQFIEQQLKMEPKEKKVGEHFPLLKKKSKPCVYCRSKSKLKNIRTSKYACQGCQASQGKDVPLCLSCMDPYHRQTQQIYINHQSSLIPFNQLAQKISLNHLPVNIPEKSPYFFTDVISQKQDAIILSAKQRETTNITTKKLKRIQKIKKNNCKQSKLKHKQPKEKKIQKCDKTHKKINFIDGEMRENLQMKINYENIDQQTFNQWNPIFQSFNNLLEQIDKDINNEKLALAKEKSIALLLTYQKLNRKVIFLQSQQK